MAMMMKLIMKKMVMGTREEAMGMDTVTKKTATATRTKPSLRTELVSTAMTWEPMPTKRQAHTAHRRQLMHQVPQKQMMIVENKKKRTAAAAILMKKSLITIK